MYTHTYLHTHTTYVCMCIYIYIHENDDSRPPIIVPADPALLPCGTAPEAVDSKVAYFGYICSTQTFQRGLVWVERISTQNKPLYYLLRRRPRLRVPRCCPTRASIWRSWSRYKFS